MLMLFVMQSFGQDEDSCNKAYINKYIIISSDFKNVLDSFLVNESQYSYFSMDDTSVIFPITVMDSVGNIMQLTSGKKGFFVPYYLQNSILGILKYSGISFIINGRASPNSKLLYKTKKKISIPIKKSIKHDYPIEDDSFFPTVWIFNYEDGSLEVVYRSKMETNK